jgi:hypothetical protein
LRIDLDLVFPETDDTPALRPETSVVAGVTQAIAFDFLLPFLRKLVPPDWKAPSVPEISVNEDDNPSFAKDDIGTAWQIAGMRLETQAHCLQERNYGSFRTGILSPDPRHNCASHLGTEEIAPMAPGFNLASFCRLLNGSW